FANGTNDGRADRGIEPWHIPAAGENTDQAFLGAHATSLSFSSSMQKENRRKRLDVQEASLRRDSIRRHEFSMQRKSVVGSLFFAADVTIQPFNVREAMVLPHFLRLGYPSLLGQCLRLVSYATGALPHLRIRAF